MDIEVQMEGKDIKVKLGLGKKEHIAASMKQIKKYGEDCKITLRQANQDIKANKLKKIQKIVSKEFMKSFEAEIEQIFRKSEKDCNSLIQAK